MDDKNRTKEELIQELRLLRTRLNQSEQRDSGRRPRNNNVKSKGHKGKVAYGQAFNGVEAPNLLSARAVTSETIDLGRLLSKELTDSGSFNIRGDIWATTFGKLLQAMPIPALLLDETVRVFQANEACGRLVHDYEALLGSSFTDLITDPSTARQVKSFAQEVFSDRKSRCCETWLSDDHRHLWTRITFRSIRFVGQRYVLALIEDLTPEKEQLILNKRHKEALEAEIARRKQTETLLKQSEEKHRIVVDSAAEAIVVSRQGRIVFANSEAIRRSGYSAEEIIAKPFADFIHPEDRQIVAERHERRLSGEEVTSAYPIRVVKKDGDTWWGYFNQVVITWEGAPAVLSLGTDITELKKAEGALRESEAKYRFLAENMHDILWTADLDLRTTYVSPSIEKVLGVTPEEGMGQTLRYLLTAESYELARSRLVTELQRDMEQGVSPDRTVKLELDFWRKDGSVACLETLVSIVRDSCSKPIGLYGLSRDISDRKLAEELLRESEEKFRALSEATFEAIFLTDQGICIGQNLSAEAMFGYTTEEVVGKGGAGLLAPESREGVLHNMLSGFEEPYEAVALRKDGSTFPCEIQGKMINYRGNQIRVAALRDITERKQAQQALRASEESYRRLFDGSRDGIYITTLDGDLVEANQSLLDIFGFTRDEINSLNVLASYSDPDARKKFQKQIELEGSVKDYEIKLLRKDGTEADCLITTSVRRSEKGTIDGYHGILRDVTEQKRLQNRLTQAHKMEAIGTLAGGIAHDFNNILYAITGFTELALEDVAEEGSTKEYLKRVIAAGERAKFLVNQILTFSRRTEQEKKPILVAPIVQEVCKFLRASLPATIAIYQDIDRRLGSILGDPTQIHQVLMNLCTNAGHAMRRTGGELFVGLHEVELDSTAIAGYQGVPAGVYQRLVVRDTGTGIEPSVKERMFDPYFSTKEKGEGTGLGLAVVHGIVQGHKGIIRVNSTLSKGTAFEVYLPVVEEEPTLEKHTAAVPMSGSERILLVDDEETIVEIVEAMLERLGYSVVTTGNSFQALELFRTDPEGFDLVITDMTMPNMTGKDLAEKMIAIRRDIPIILCTGFSELITEEQAKSIGIRELIMKPITKNELGETIRRVLGA